MKNKIKVMRDPHDISDQELERFKDFDSLLTQHQKLLKKSQSGLWKGLGAVAVVAVTLTTYLILKTDDVPPTKEISLVGIDSVKVKQETSTLEVGIDTSAIVDRKETTLPQVAEKKQSVKQEANDQHAPIEETSTSPVSESSASLPAEKHSLSQKSESVYIQAEPVEGYEALYSYFSRELIYPEVAIQDSIQGVLTVSFLINKEGKPEQIQTSGVLGEAFDQEAIRLIENMPAWKPATLNGRVVVSKLTLPLTFQLK